MKGHGGGGDVLGQCLISFGYRNNDGGGLFDARYTLVEILYLGDMLLWNQMKLKMTPMVLGMLSS